MWYVKDIFQCADGKPPYHFWSSPIHPNSTNPQGVSTKVVLHNSETGAVKELSFTSGREMIRWLNHIQPVGFISKSLFSSEYKYAVCMDNFSLQFMKYVAKVEIVPVSLLEYKVRSVKSTIETYEKGSLDWSTLICCTDSDDMGCTLFQAVLLGKKYIIDNVSWLNGPVQFVSPKDLEEAKRRGIERTTYESVFKITFNDIDSVMRLIAKASIFYKNPLREFVYPED